MAKETTISLTLDGIPLTAYPGQTLAAVLMSNGIRSWRTTRFEYQPRGVLCGIGVCFDCLITLNGMPNVRACTTEASNGDELNSQLGTGHGHFE